MRSLYPYSVWSLTALAVLLCTTPSNAGDRLSFPPTSPSAKPAAKLTMIGVQQEINNRFKLKFQAAAGPDGRLTAQDARNAGWGFVADHFADIDKAGRGSVGLDQVQNYMGNRSPLAPALAAAAAKEKAETAKKPAAYGPIQIIE